MNSIMQGIFRLLMSWVKTVAAWLWNGSTQDAAPWSADRILTIAVILCLVCTVIDVIIHLCRWRDDLVVRSWLERRVRRREQQKQLWAAEQNKAPGAADPDRQPAEAGAAPSRYPPLKAYAKPLTAVVRTGKATFDKVRDFVEPEEEGFSYRRQQDARSRLPIDRETAYQKAFTPPQWQDPAGDQGGKQS